MNETAYLADSPDDYYFPTGTEQWEPDALIQLDDQIESFQPIKTKKSKHPHRSHSQKNVHKSHP
jgi:hypothetical protein